MRVLHVISGLDPENGGPTTALIGMAEAQAAAGLQVSVMATWQRTSGFPNAERMKSCGIDVTLVGQAYGKLSRHRELRERIEAAVAKADVVHVHALWEQIQHEAMRAAGRQNVPYVVTPHGMLSRWSFTKNRLAKTLYFHWAVRPGLKRANVIHFTAESEYAQAQRFNLSTPTLIEPCGIDLVEFESSAKPGEFRRNYPQIGQRSMLLFLGRLAPQKGLDLLINAFAQFVDGDTTQTMLVLAGPDENVHQHQLQDYLQRLPNAEEVMRRIVFTGMLSGQNRIDALRDADLFVLPSRHENFGIVVAESLAAGTPVLVSRGVNIFREIDAAHVGQSVNHWDASDFAFHMRRWMTDPALRRDAASKATVFARQNYDWRKIASRWVGHYRDMKASHSNRAQRT